MDNIIQFESANVKITPFSIEFANGTSFEEWRSVYEKLEKFDGIMQLYIGDCLNFGSYAYGEKYTEFMKHSKYEYGTLRVFCSVANRFPPSMREALLSQDNKPSFTQLRIVAPLEDTKVVQLLSLAGECGWNKDRLGEEVQKIRHPDITPFEAIKTAIENANREPEENRDVSVTPAMSDKEKIRILREALNGLLLRHLDLFGDDRHEEVIAALSALEATE